MKKQKLRALGETEIQKQLDENQDKLFRIRLQMSMGQSEGVRKLREIRKDRARMLTLQRERELAAVVSATVANTQAKAKVSAAPEKDKPAKDKPAKAEGKVE